MAGPDSAQVPGTTRIFNRVTGIHWISEEVCKEVAPPGIAHCIALAIRETIGVWFERHCQMPDIILSIIMISHRATVIHPVPQEVCKEAALLESASCIRHLRKARGFVLLFEWPCCMPDRKP